MSKFIKVFISHLIDFLDDFIKEQLEAQFELGTLLRKLERIGNDGHGLTQMDNEMLEKFK